MQEDFSRFDSMFDDAQEHVEQKEKALEKCKKAAAEEERKIERKGECQGCGQKGYNRWVDNGEFYSCAECFIYSLQCQADVMVPRYSVDQMDGYDEYCNWEDLWENNE